MTAIQFVAAAKQDIRNESDEPLVFEFSIAGQEFVADLPNTAQSSLILITSQSGSTAETVAVALDILKVLLHGTGYKRLHRLMVEGLVDYNLLLWGDDRNPQGIIQSLLAQVSAGRPTVPSSDSASSPQNGGRRSTGRSPGQGSTRSASPSTDS